MEIWRCGGHKCPGQGTHGLYNIPDSPPLGEGAILGYNGYNVSGLGQKYIQGEY